jgi:HSP20 family protein
VLASERPQGKVSRQLLLGENLDLDHLEANYDRGVLTLTIPVAASAKPRKVQIGSAEANKAITV